MNQATSVSEDKKDGRKTKSIPVALGKITRELALLAQSAALEDQRRAGRKERLVKLFRTGFRGIEKSIANHPSFAEDDLDFFKEEGFNV
jgi:hypothetical protein